jgi:hypothetical protein
MKKNRIKDRLRLNRETIRLLSDPALLGLARGGYDTGVSCPCGATDSCIVQNCVPTGCSGKTTTANTDNCY